jgi:hypothetical protein
MLDCILRAISNRKPIKDLNRSKMLCKICFERIALVGRNLVDREMQVFGETC